MIIGEWKPVAELVETLRGRKKVLVAGCATCVAECAAGGEREVETLAPLLRMGLKKKGHDVEIVTHTIERQCEWEFVEELEKVLGGVDAVLSLACGIGVQAVAERFQDVPIYPGVNTTALAIREEPGLWTARCAACGDCVLGETFGLCPIARCAKSLLNGPCGGTHEGGKCEVNHDNDCVWCLIYERAKARGAVDSLIEVKRSKGWSSSSHGGQKRMLREDLRS
ncbi:MAG: methylenetetrahydrofolate reductase C-terminal domain-containing protein [Deltaproteobacteria bacterium]|nr:methylenetetrahydrofolate reductase C-terminal domain-containing protein [Deltaproteobacteria bacterium]